MENLIDPDSKSVRPWTGSTRASDLSSITKHDDDDAESILIESLHPSPNPTRTLLKDMKPSTTKHNGTPYLHLPSQGPFAKHTKGLPAFTTLSKSGRRFHLRTKLQNEEKEAHNLNKKRQKALKKKKKFKEPVQNHPSTTSKGVSKYTQALRKGLANYYHINVCKQSLSLWFAMTLLAERTGNDEKDLLEPPPPPPPEEDEEEETNKAEDEDKDKEEDKDTEDERLKEEAADVDTADNDEEESEETNIKAVVLDQHGIGRPLYYRFYRRLFVTLRSLQDNLDLNECKKRIRDAEVLAGIIKKEEKKSKINFMRRSSSQKSMKSKEGMSMMNVVGKSNALKNRRRSETTDSPISSAKKRWGMIKKEVVTMISWRDLLKKRQDTRAAKAVSSGELGKIHKLLAMKDWSNDSTSVDVEVPISVATTNNSDLNLNGMTESKILAEESRILKKKRMSSDKFKESMIVIARHYSKSGSSQDFVKLLKNILQICFYDIDLTKVEKLTRRNYGRPRIKDRKETIVVLVPRRKRVDPMAWTERRRWDLKGIQQQGHKKLWESSCRLPNNTNYKVTKEKQHWFDEEDEKESYNNVEELQNTRIQVNEWTVGFGGTVHGVANKKDRRNSPSKYSFASSW